MTSRPSEEEVERLLANGRALQAQAADERSEARLLVAAGFLAYWKASRGAVPLEEVAASEQSAHRALAIAERLDDPMLRSAALDALSSCALERGAWDEARAFARRRLDFQDRLSLHERLDAHCMVTWSACLLGDLGEASRISAAGLALVQPGQDPGWALHLAAWRTYALALSGDWDGSLAAADLGYRLWRDAGRIAAGYALRGFIAGAHVARARLDAPSLERCRVAADTIIAAFGTGAAAAGLRPLLTGAVDDIHAWLQQDFGFLHLRSEYAERGLALCADAGRPPPAATVRPIVRFATSSGCVPLVAQAERALGLALQDPAPLARSLALWERIGAVPYVARVRCELARLSGDDAAFRVGLQALEALGDVEQAERFRRL